ncbi:hypothetical protein WJ438_06900 [Streptomyces sp. GD-15H]|uniref:hypothetical protein n=1 Tax=Streptomyces sp. GD-15H TaxID=3129112 RepID=UPI00324E53A2
MADDAGREREVADQVPQSQAGDGRPRDDEVPHDQAAGGPGQPYDRGHGRELVPYDDRVRRLQGQVGTRAPHGDARVGGGEGGRVVDAVADEGPCGRRPGGLGRR